MVRKKIIKDLLLVCVLIILAACTGSGTSTLTLKNSTQDPQENFSIVLGDISDDPAEVIEGTQPLADYLATQLSEYGVTDGQVKVAATMNEMAQLMVTEQVDLYFDSIYPATLVSDIAGAQPILRRWRFGVEQYQSVIFASLESGITSIDDLPGHLIAMDSPYSTSGYFLPAVHLVKHDLNLTGKRSYNDPVSEDELGFVFSYDDENTLQWVLNGLVSAGVTDDYRYDVAFPSSATDKLVVLDRTESVPRQVVVVRPDMDPDMLDSIILILINAHNNEEGRAALEPFQTSRFDEFPQGLKSATDRMREMMSTVQDLPLP